MLILGVPFKRVGNVEIFPLEAMIFYGELSSFFDQKVRCVIDGEIGYLEHVEYQNFIFIFTLKIVWTFIYFELH